MQISLDGMLSWDDGLGLIDGTSFRHKLLAFEQVLADLDNLIGIFQKVEALGNQELKFVHVSLFFLRLFLLLFSWSQNYPNVLCSTRESSEEMRRNFQECNHFRYSASGAVESLDLWYSEARGCLGVAGGGHRTTCNCRSWWGQHTWLKDSLSERVWLTFLYEEPVTVF